MRGGETVKLLFGGFALAPGTGTVPVPATPVATLSSPALPATSPLSAFHVQISNPTTIASAGGGAGTGKATLDEVPFTMPLDANAVALFNAAGSGSRIATLAITRPSSAGDDTYTCRTRCRTASRSLRRVRLTMCRRRK